MLFVQKARESEKRMKLKHDNSTQKWELNEMKKTKKKDRENKRRAHDMDLDICGVCLYV